MYSSRYTVRIYRMENSKCIIHNQSCYLLGGWEGGREGGGWDGEGEGGREGISMRLAVSGSESSFPGQHFENCQ